jgi:hypothetical protein
VKSSGLSTGLILREQPDKVAAITHIALLIDRVAKLWQMQNWTQENSVMLAEWTFETYSCEPLEVITGCLKNPPVSAEKTWRLTPEVIAQWMTGTLEKEAIAREKEHQRLKDEFKTELPNVNYESFKKRLAEGTALSDDKRKTERWTQDEAYQKFKAERMLKMREQPPTENKETKD